MARRRARAELLQWRYRRSLREMRHYALFIGYPRSGHTLVSSLLDAHPRMLFANGLDVTVYLGHGFSARHVAALSILNSLRFTRNGRRSNGFDYAVPSGRHGSWEALEVVGDKSGDLFSDRLRRDPALLPVVLDELSGIAKFIHVVRNPFDCIATIASRGQTSLITAADLYFELAGVNGSARNQVAPWQWMDVYLEDLIADPRVALQELCEFLGQAASIDYLENCAKLVFSSPRRSRDAAGWDPELVRAVVERMQAFPWLRDFSFERSGRDCGSGSARRIRPPGLVRSRELHAH